MNQLRTIVWDAMSKMTLSEAINFAVSLGNDKLVIYADEFLQKFGDDLDTGSDDYGE